MAGALRRRHESTVRLAGLLVGDFSAGEELAQDAFARLFEAGPAFFVDRNGHQLVYFQAT
ncbi:MAG: hypothetical protein ACYCUG_01910 [Acidimicrobiales bacterium]